MQNFETGIDQPLDHADDPSNRLLLRRAYSPQHAEAVLESIHAARRAAIVTVLDRCLVGNIGALNFAAFKGKFTQ